MDLLVGIGMGVGIASVAGLRAFLPLAGALSIVLFSGFGNPPWMFMQINDWLSLPVLGALLGLLILESILDKLAVTGRYLDRAMVPIRALSGAVVFGIASVEWSLLDPMLGPMSSGHFVKLPAGLPLLAPYLAAGAVVAGAVATLKARLPLAARSPRSKALRSLGEDVVAIVGSVVPLLGLVLVVLLLSSRLRTRSLRTTLIGDSR